jgi:hypothetical protein
MHETASAFSHRLKFSPWRGLTPLSLSLHHASVSANEQTPLQKTILWLANHAGFPARRLPDRAELLLLIATAAAEEDLGSRHAQKKPGLQFNPAFAAQIRNYTAQRRRAHINCDNSAKT